MKLIHKESLGMYIVKNPKSKEYKYNNNQIMQLAEGVKAQRVQALLNDARQMKQAGDKLSNNSTAGYFSTFRAMLKVAHRDKRIKENVNEYLDKIKWKETKREYLTIDEIKSLVATPCNFPVLKYASLFSCLTGLRISDILNLKWENIEPLPNGNGFCMRIRTEKTDFEELLPISEEGSGILWQTIVRSDPQRFKENDGERPFEDLDKGG